MEEIMSHKRPYINLGTTKRILKFWNGGNVINDIVTIL